MSRNPHQVTKDFEAALCEYTGAPYAVAVNSCTMALTLAVAWHLRDAVADRALALVSPHGYPGYVPPPTEITIPKRTYVSVPQAIIRAGGRPVFEDREWLGMYQLAPLPVWDSARWFTSGMYLGHHVTEFPARAGSGVDKVKFVFPLAGNVLCVSFHASKTLGLEQGGAILHDNPEADAWFRRARFDGRAEGVAPKDDAGIILGWHCYMNPSTAAQGILKLHSLSRHNAPLPNDDYPDLSTLECFK